LRAFFECCAGGLEGHSKMMELPDNTELLLALYRAKQREALNSAGDTDDPCIRTSWLRIAESYFHLTQQQPEPRVRGAMLHHFSSSARADATAWMRVSM
jgi:hypothetical protein